MISTKGRYALRVMVDLAQHEEDKSEASPDERGSFIPLEEIAERQGISKKYLEIILKALVQHKLLKGLRGKGGGYKLTRRPKDYTVGEVLTITEGNLAIVSCLLDTEEPCARQCDCITFPMWKEFDRLTHDFFFNITLEDLVNKKIPKPQKGSEK